MTTEARRADATRNRDRIVAAARIALTADGHATTNSIAAAAGVGQGTLYRHFPTREDLLVAAYEDDLRELLDVAPTLLARRTPTPALRAWLVRLAAYGHIKRSVLEAVETSRHQGLSNRYGDETLEVIGTFLAAGVEAGELRADVDAEDLLALVGFLWRLDDATARANVARLIDVVISGLAVSSPAGRGAPAAPGDRSPAAARRSARPASRRG